MSRNDGIVRQITWEVAHQTDWGDGGWECLAAGVAGVANVRGCGHRGTVGLRPVGV